MGWLGDLVVLLTARDHFTPRGLLRVIHLEPSFIMIFSQLYQPWAGLQILV